MAVKYRELAKAKYLEEDADDYYKYKYLLVLSKQYFPELYSMYFDEQCLLYYEEQYVLCPEEYPDLECEKKEIRRKAHQLAYEKAREKAMEFYYLECGIELELGRQLSITEHDMILALHVNEEIGMLDSWVENTKDIECPPPAKCERQYNYIDEKYYTYVEEDYLMYRDELKDAEMEMEFHRFFNIIDSKLWRSLSDNECNMIRALYYNGEFELVYAWLDREKGKYVEHQPSTEHNCNPYAMQGEGL